MVTGIGTSAAAAITGTSHAGARATTAVAGTVVVVAEVRLGVALVDYEVDWHFAFQTADVALTKVVAQFVNLRNETRSEWQEVNVLAA